MDVIYYILQQKYCDPDTIHRMLTYMPDIESKTAHGETPLIIAVRHGKLLSVKYPLEREPIL